ncbi:MAG: M81 family metallopeptidase [Casimicrobiaceae bacterium]
MPNLAGKRIAVGGFLHETNTFQPQPTTYADFAEAGDRPPLVRGPELLARFDGVNSSIAGAIGVLKPQGATLLPLVWASATPSGYVSDDAFERIAAMLIADLKASLPIDAVYLNLHGAMCTERVEDPEGELLTWIRAIVGPNVPIVASLDLHSNTSSMMFELCDAMVGYTTYPHVDMRETGEKAALLLGRILHSGTVPAKAYRQLPYLIPLTWQCTVLEPSKSIYHEAAKMVGDRVASTSFTPGFPAADIRDCGAAVMAYGWDRAGTESAVDALYRMVLEAEPQYGGRLYAPGEAVREAMRRMRQASRPVVLADTQDNPGAGGSADTVGLLGALIDNNATRAVMGIIHDPDAARAAHSVGEKARITIGIGAKSGAWGERPLVREWTVERLGDGAMTCHGPMMTGWKLALGPMALLSSGGVRVVLSSRKIQAMDPEPFRHLGAEPAAQGILALKSSVHFRAALAPVAGDVLVVESPGAMMVDPSKLPFKRLRHGVRMRPLGPAFPLR